MPAAKQKKIIEIQKSIKSKFVIKEGCYTPHLHTLYFTLKYQNQMTDDSDDSKNNLLFTF
jgi:hypothetical protein